YNVSANNIEFTPDDQDWKVENVQGALNDLYSKKQIDVSNMTLVDSKYTQVLNANSTSSTYTNLSKGTYFLYAIRTVTVTRDSKSYAESSSRTEQSVPRNGIPTITVSSGTITKIDDEFYIVRITENNSTITINSSNTGASTTSGGYLYSTVYMVN
ncbi:MAG: hypothetical protein IKP79_01395, partial [Bacilli bacterium]|nr:hypothetical protein [Bacilli bacterium]